jgi:uncharacterized protein YndB with AHSA1/START domain
VTATDPTAITVDQFVPHPPGRVWEALVDPEQVSSYFMATDFRPEIGADFTFTRRTVKPELREGRTIRCRVLELRPPEVLAYSWADAECEDGLDSVVTWTLHPEGTGTRILLEHRGFDPADPVIQQLRDVMIEGWGRLVHQLLTGHLAGLPDGATA